MAKVKTVRLELVELVSDRLQYKPYTARLGSPDGKEFPKVYVDIPLGENLIAEEGEGAVDISKYVVVSVDGLAAILGKVADAIETMNDEYKNKIMKRS